MQLQYVYYTSCTYTSKNMMYCTKSIDLFFKDRSIKNFRKSDRSDRSGSDRRQPYYLLIKFKILWVYLYMACF